MAAVSTSCLGGRRAADASAPAEIRGALVTFARRHAAGDEVVRRVRLVASEAVSNVVMHAYDHADGDVVFAASATGGVLHISITDCGCGLDQPTRNPGAGYGLRIIEAESDRCSITAAKPCGVEVQAEFMLA